MIEDLSPRHASKTVAAMLGKHTASSSKWEMIPIRADRRERELADSTLVRSIFSAMNAHAQNLTRSSNDHHLVPDKACLRETIFSLESPQAPAELRVKQSVFIRGRVGKKTCHGSQVFLGGD